MPKTTDGLKILDALGGKSRAMQRMYKEAGVKILASEKVYQLRTQAGLSQTELARRIGCSPSVIERLEAADYDRRTTAMLKRITTELGRRAQVRVAPRKRRPQPGPAAGN